MEVVNVFEPALDLDHDRPGYRWRGLRVGRKLGAEGIGATVYELEAGERICPYHYHHGNEEWLLVLEGEPTVRLPDGERTLRRGDLVCFPTGPEGAHAVTGPGRVMILSTMVAPGLVVYPDSDKLGTRPGWGHPDNLNFLRGDEVDYWDGE